MFGRPIVVFYTRSCIANRSMRYLYLVDFLKYNTTNTILIKLYQIGFESAMMYLLRSYISNQLNLKRFFLRFNEDLYRLYLSCKNVIYLE